MKFAFHSFFPFSKSISMLFAEHDIISTVDNSNRFVFILQVLPCTSKLIC